MTDFPPSECDNKTNRYGAVALIGRTNAGKSTLLNVLAGEKVAITSRKVQTTRFPIRAIVNHNESQIVFVDTPGLFKARRNFDRAMIAAAWQSLDDVDVAALLVDASHPQKAEDYAAVLKRMAEEKAENERVLILNKVDTAPRARLLEMAAGFSAACPFARVFMISALTGDGTGDFLDWCASAMPGGEAVYPADMVTTMPSRLLAAEITREHIYDRLHKELPYHIAVVTDSFEYGGEGARNGLAIRQTIVIENPKHKPIVLGRAGQTLKAIGSAARADLSAVFECPVRLDLHVRHSDRWMDRHAPDDQDA